ncbi:MAG: phage major capsid protein [Myxococcales bacterium]|nr:phage major capsid protein [Myxococcales bacterium]
MKRKAERKATVETRLQFRAAEVGKVDADARTVELAISSEHAVSRYFGTETLAHTPEAVDLSRVEQGVASVLRDHWSSDHLGIIESARLDGKTLRAVVRFSKHAAAEEVLQDVLDGTRRGVSIGYWIRELTLVKSDDEGDHYLATRWELAEVSFVSIPADPTVGVGRDAEAVTIQTRIVGNEETEAMLKVYDFQARKWVEIEEGAFDPSRHATREAAEAMGVREDAQPPTQRSADVVDLERRRSAQVADDAAQAERKRAAEIMRLATRHHQRELGERAVAEGTALELFRGQLLDAIPRGSELDDTPDKLGLGERDLNRYSVMRAITAASDKTATGCDFERECHREIVNRGAKDYRGIAIPYDVLADPRYLARGVSLSGRSATDALVQQLAQIALGRAVEKGGTASGAALVATDLLAGRFIDLLRNRVAALAAGATVLDGLVGDVTIPRLASASAATWVVEGGGAGSSTPTTDLVSLSPKTLRGRVDVTRKMLLQSTPAAEALTRADMLRVQAIAMDLALLKGSGVSPVPRGILNTSGVGSVAFSAAATWWADVVDMETDVAVANADMGSLAYIVPAAARGMAKKNPRFGAGTSIAIWGDGNELNGYPAFVSNQLSATALAGEAIFGNFADLLLGIWGAMDVMVDPYALGDSGGLVVRVFQDADCGVRHPESFSIQDDATFA